MTTSHAVKQSILAAFFSSGVTVGALAPRMAEIKESIGATNASYGSAFAFNAVGGLIGYFLSTRVIQRFSSREAAWFSLFAIAILNYSYAWARNPETLSVQAFCGGILYSIFYVSINTQAVHYERAGQKSFLPRAHALWSLGALLGSGFTSLIAPYFDVKSTLLIVDICVILLWAFTGRGLAHYQSETGKKHQSRDLPKEVVPRKTFFLLILLAVAQTLAMLAEGTASDWSAIMLHEDLKISIGPNGYAFAFFSLVQLATRFFAPKYIDDFGIKRVVSVSGYSGVAGFLIFHVLSLQPFSLSAKLLFSCMAFGFLSFGLAIMVPAFASTAGNLPNISSARALMIVGVAGSIFLWIGRTGFSILADVLSLPTTITLFAVGVVIASVIVQRIAPDKDAHKSQLR